MMARCVLWCSGSAGPASRVDGDVVGRLDADPRASCVLVGVTHDDTDADRGAAGRQGARAADPRRRAVRAAETGAPLLVVSQFTLYGDTRKGRRPTWNAAAPGPVAEPLVDDVVADLRALGAQVETGRFGADMQLALVNDGPVTLSWRSDRRTLRAPKILVRRTTPGTYRPARRASVAHPVTGSGQAGTSGLLGGGEPAGDQGLRRRGVDRFTRASAIGPSS